MPRVWFTKKLSKDVVVIVVVLLLAVLLLYSNKCLSLVTNS